MRTNEKYRDIEFGVEENEEYKDNALKERMSAPWGDDSVLVKVMLSKNIVFCNEGVFGNVNMGRFVDCNWGEGINIIFIIKKVYHFKYKK